MSMATPLPMPQPHPLAHARTLLFVPGDRPERFDKAWASGADAVVLDLEDAVAPDAKAAARHAVALALRGWDAARLARTVLRVNAAGTPWWAEDLALLAQWARSGSGATGAAGAAGAAGAVNACGAVMVPKAESLAQLAQVAQAGQAATAAASPTWALLPLVETARGVLAAEALAAAPGVVRLVFGTLDFALDMDLSGDPIGLDHAASRLSLASRAAGIAAPVAGVTATLDDESLLLADLARARAHGFGAKLCIHPRQVAPVHAALQPSADALAQARRILAAAEAAGGAAVPVDGRMVDAPVIARARRLLARCT